MTDMWRTIAARLSDLGRRVSRLEHTEYGAAGGGTALTVEEQDGAPSVTDVGTIRVTNGTLTDEGGGVAKLDFGSAATDGSAIHDNVAEEIHAITEKETPADDDELLIEDSADLWAKKRVKMSNLPGGGAPADAEYVVEAANDSLSNEAVLGAKVITTTTYGARQAAARAGRLFLPSDGFYVERDAGAAWAPWGPLYPFTPPVNGDFSWVNQGTATVDTTYGGIILYGPAAGSDNWRLRIKAAPAAPYTVTIAFIYQGMKYNYSCAALGWRDSNTGELHLAEYSETNSINSVKFNSPTSWSGSYAKYNLGHVGQIMWLQIEDNNTDRIIKWSQNGHSWTTIHSVARADFLNPDQVCFGVNPVNGTWPVYMTVLHWKDA